MLRRGALLTMLCVPFFFYAAYARRDDPIWSVISVVVALSIFGFCVWVLRRATRLEPTRACRPDLRLGRGDAVA
jgi:hypothetical protein